MTELYGLELVITGKRVQKAGVRSEVERAAIDAGVTGIVENIEDKDEQGRIIRKVKIICEGSEEELKKFIDDLNKINGYNIIDKIPPAVIDGKKSIKERKFGEFKIERKEKEIPERFDEAAFYMKQMSGSIGQMSNNMGQMSQETKEMNENMKEFRKETRDNFDTLNRKYHTISQNLTLMTGLIATYLKNKEPGLKDSIESLEREFRKKE